MRTDLTAAEALLAQAQLLAENQGALAWQLRIAVSVARIRQAQGRAFECRLHVEQVLSRFTQGLQDADPTSARQLLQRLSESDERA